MKKDQISAEIKTIKKEISDIHLTLNQINARLDNKPALPEKRLRPNPMGKGKHFSHKLIGGFRDPVVRKMVMELRKQGHQYTEIATTIRDRYPDNPEKHVSRSAIHRFYKSARMGRLLEYGIGRTI
jgi:hypothetical protein